MTDKEQWCSCASLPPDTYRSSGPNATTRCSDFNEIEPFVNDSEPPWRESELVRCSDAHPKSDSERFRCTQRRIIRRYKMPHIGAQYHVSRHGEPSGRSSILLHFLPNALFDINSSSYDQVHSGAFVNVFLLQIGPANDFDTSQNHLDSSKARLSLSSIHPSAENLSRQGLIDLHRFISCSAFVSYPVLAPMIFLPLPS